MTDGYDSGPETIEHQRDVARLLMKFASQLLERAREHDESKLGPVEKPIFDAVLPTIKGSEVGRYSYEEGKAKLGEALEHHYAANRHHPEHFGDAGIRGMTLVDLVEMWCDWNAARHRGEDSRLRLDYVGERFQIGPQILEIMLNTAEADETPVQKAENTFSSETESERNRELREAATALLTWVGFYAAEHDDYQYWVVQNCAKVLGDERQFADFKKTSKEKIAVLERGPAPDV